MNSFQGRYQVFISGNPLNIRFIQGPLAQPKDCSRCERNEPVQGIDRNDNRIKPNGSPNSAGRFPPAFLHWYHAPGRTTAFTLSIILVVVSRCRWLDRSVILSTARNHPPKYFARRLGLAAADLERVGLPRDLQRYPPEGFFSVPHPLWNQIPLAWLTGFAVALLMGGDTLVRFGLAGEITSQLSLAAGLLFIPSLALAFGVWTGCIKAFEVVHVVFWYLG
jgi:hypothetical protein